MDLVEDLYIEKVNNSNEVVYNKDKYFEFNKTKHFRTYRDNSLNLFNKFVKEYKLKNPTYNSNNNIPDWIYL
jgi:hypothetical protein